jgi:DNA repair protein RadC
VELREGVKPVGDLLNDPALVKTFARSWAGLGDADQETTWALYLTARNRLISAKTCYVGTLDRAVVEPRQILVGALLEGAAAIILCHNHPSGDPTPSREDREFTRRLATAAETVGIRLLDHVVIGNGPEGGAVSFREAGLL